MPTQVKLKTHPHMVVVFADKLDTEPTGLMVSAKENGVIVPVATRLMTLSSEPRITKP